MDEFKAARDGDETAIAGYLRKGGNIDAGDSNGLTLLIVAVDNGRHGMVKFLLSKGADPNRTDTWGQTALMLAAGRNDTACVKMLTGVRANMDIKAKNGLTALGYAVDNGRREAADLIRKAGGR